MTNKRGFYAIGIFHTKKSHNIGSLYRSAFLLGAQYIFTVGRRYQHQCSDTVKAPKHLPLFHYKDTEDFYNHIPLDTRLVGIELSNTATPLRDFIHPERCIYVLGAEDYGLPEEMMEKCHRLVKLPGEYSMNVACAGTCVIMDRVNKSDYEY